MQATSPTLLGGHRLDPLSFRQPFLLSIVCEKPERITRPLGRIAENKIHDTWKLMSISGVRKIVRDMSNSSSTEPITRFSNFILREATWSSSSSSMPQSQRYRLATDDWWSGRQYMQRGLTFQASITLSGFGTSDQDRAWPEREWDIFYWPMRRCTLVELSRIYPHWPVLDLWRAADSLSNSESGCIWCLRYAGLFAMGKVERYLLAMTCKDVS